jgi:acetyl esterase/lipase
MDTPEKMPMVTVMPRMFVKSILLLLLAGCEPARNEKAPLHAAAKPSLSEARRGFITKLVRRESYKDEPVEKPPVGDLRVVQYDIAAGKAAAYLSPDPQDGKRHPAIIWIHGGTCNVIGDVAWRDAPASNDQSGRAFRKAGIITMYPALRGGNCCDGVIEGFFGEADDVLAAADYLSNQPFVDPSRVYLGGHSCGGTLVLLVAELSPRFRTVFAFGPMADVRDYDPDFLPFDSSDLREAEARSPGYWLHSINSPVHVFDGTHDSNQHALRWMSTNSTNSQVHFYAIEGGDHRNILSPTTRLIAQKIIRDVGDTSRIVFAEEEVNMLLSNSR